ncbi:hypothetical protein DET56_101164 [Paenibacillus pabuli]|uniref:Uncharacterized protein n=1 Tax=Paenibacillus pabuli TaxID=1472 RepID=A0A855YJ55_9BACL|nr:hypothetical protein DET56_101164 [Paenibacillus pabuli]PXW11300.1 hypothetical protein DEU73_101163 [Paenibacillus taichungensis]
MQLKAEFTNWIQVQIGPIHLMAIITSITSMRGSQIHAAS